jgi:hypothetical protein
MSTNVACDNSMTPIYGTTYCSFPAPYYSKFKRSRTHYKVQRSFSIHETYVQKQYRSCVVDCLAQLDLMFWADSELHRLVRRGLTGNILNHLVTRHFLFSVSRSATMSPCPQIVVCAPVQPLSVLRRTLAFGAAASISHLHHTVAIYSCGFPHQYFILPQLCE